MTVLLVVGSASLFASTATDYALEEAAFKAVAELNKRNFNIRRIAFLGLADKNKSRTQIFRGGLNRVSGNYEFYVRNEREWDVLISEIEFSDRRGDIMDQRTLQRFGDIKGVDALLYGSVLEMSEKDGKAIARVALTLAKPTTGELIWNGNVEGEYSLAVPVKVSQELLDLARKCGKNVKDSLLEELDKLPKAKVFVLPFAGEKSMELSDIIISEINISNSKLSFYSKPMMGMEKRFVQSLATEMAGADVKLDMRQLGLIMKQLEQVYDLEKTDGGSVISSNAVLAYLSGVVKIADDNGVAVTLYLRDLKDNRLLWSKTVTAKNLNSDRNLHRIYHNNRILFFGLFAMVVLFGLFKAMTRVR